MHRSRIPSKRQPGKWKIPHPHVSESELLGRAQTFCTFSGLGSRVSVGCLGGLGFLGTLGLRVSLSKGGTRLGLHSARLAPAAGRFGVGDDKFSGKERATWASPAAQVREKTVSQSRVGSVLLCGGPHTDPISHLGLGLFR